MRPVAPMSDPCQAPFESGTAVTSDSHPRKCRVRRRAGARGLASLAMSTQTLTIEQVAPLLAPSEKIAHPMANAGDLSAFTIGLHQRTRREQPATVDRRAAALGRGEEG